ncbi:hypothetical protein SprV_0100350000 [Sparganum proliferum]
MAKGNGARDFLATSYSDTSGVSRHVDLDAHYEGLRARATHWPPYAYPGTAVCNSWRPHLITSCNTEPTTQTTGNIHKPTQSFVLNGLSYTFDVFATSADRLIRKGVGALHSKAGHQAKLIFTIV